MARIRSVHPSLFTDEAVVSCSPLARMLYIGLWTDADDQGLFEWKPLQIKMRLLPGDDASVPDLLAELVGANLVARLQSGGKSLGAIRYFRRFQRPKKPNSTFVLPAEWANYVGLGDGSTEHDPPDDDAVRDQFPTDGEKSPQMEDGGGRREDGNSVPDGTAASPPDGFLVEWSELPIEKGSWRLAKHVLIERGRKTTAQAGDIVGKWMKGGLVTHQQLWAAAEATWRSGSEDPVPYMAAVLKGEIEDDSDVFLRPTEVRQRLWMQDFAACPYDWDEGKRGSKPGHLGCRVTPEIQREFGIEPAKLQAVGSVA